MKTLVVLAALLAVILAACSSGDKNSMSTTSPKPIAATPTPTATRCVPDDLDMAPCPGTPEPVIHTPLPPPGPIADSEVAKHLPVSLSEYDRKIIERVMQAQPDFERPNVSWVYCRGKIFVFLGPPEAGSPASKVLNDDPHSREHGGDFINYHNCIDYPMPGA